MRYQKQLLGVVKVFDGAKYLPTGDLANQLAILHHRATAMVLVEHGCGHRDDIVAGAAATVTGLRCMY
jgi:hypothetical protein